VTNVREEINIVFYHNKIKAKFHWNLLHNSIAIIHSFLKLACTEMDRRLHRELMELDDPMMDLFSDFGFHRDILEPFGLVRAFP
jgi:hypothetical protein